MSGDPGALGPWETQHVYPTWGPKHETDGRPCWCSPRVEREASGDVVIHNPPAD